MNKAILIMGMVGLMVSCKKDDVNKGKPNNETTILKLPQGESELYGFALDAVPGNITLKVLEVRRDVKSEADLNKSIVVKIQQDQTLIDDYNTANGTNLELFTAYTLDPSTTFDGQNWSVPFGPGEFVKYITIGFDPTSLDFSVRHAIGFKIVDGGGATISATKGQALVEIAVKNKYDGVYEATGTMVDLTAATLTGYYPITWELQTSGPNSVVVFDADVIGGPFHAILSSGALSYYGSFGIEVTFDPATDKVASVVNVWGQPAGNTRSAQLDPSGINAWDPNTGNVDIKYFMLQPSVVPTPPNVRTTFDEHWEYKGPR